MTIEDKNRLCPDCDYLLVEEIKETVVTIHRHHEPVSITYKTPVFVCKQCGYMFTDWRNEDAIDKAISDYIDSLEN